MLKNSWGEVTEVAEYQGRKVQLNNPTRGDVKKFKVFVKNDRVMLSRLSLVIQTWKSNEMIQREEFSCKTQLRQSWAKYKARYWSCKFGKKVNLLQI